MKWFTLEKKEVARSRDWICPIIWLSYWWNLHECSTEAGEKLKRKCEHFNFVSSHVFWCIFLCSICTSWLLSFKFIYEPQVNGIWVYFVLYVWRQIEGDCSGYGCCSACLIVCNCFGFFYISPYFYLSLFLILMQKNEMGSAPLLCSQNTYFIFWRRRKKRKYQEWSSDDRCFRG